MVMSRLNGLRISLDKNFTAHAQDQDRPSPVRAGIGLKIVRVSICASIYLDMLSDIHQNNQLFFKGKYAQPLSRKGRKGGFFVGFVQILEERPQLNTLRCHGHEFHGACPGSEHTKP
jgi:hypothetical protein